MQLRNKALLGAAVSLSALALGTTSAFAVTDTVGPVSQFVLTGTAAPVGVPTQIGGPVLVGTTNWYSGPVKVKINVTDSGNPTSSGVAKFDVTVDGSPPTTITGGQTSYEFNVSSAGPHTVTSTATDGNGNPEISTKSISFSVDNSVPITTAVATPFTQVSTTSVKVDFAATDPDGVGQFLLRTTVGSAPFVDTFGPTKSITVTTPGVTVIKYQSADLLGHVEPVKTITVVIDKTKPSAPTFNGSYLLVVQPTGNTFLTGTAKDNVGTASVKVRIASSKRGLTFDQTYTAICMSCGLLAPNPTWSLNLATLVPPLPKNGTFTTQISSTDSAGNASPVTAGPALATPA